MTYRIWAALCVLGCLPALAQTAPGFEDVTAVPLPQQEYGYRGMPGSIIELKDGRLLLGYTAYDASGNGTGAVAGRYSRDRGRTWGEEFTLVAAPRPAAKDRYCHPSFLRLPDGQLLMSYIYGSGALPLFGHSYYRRSVNDGAEWGDQLILSPRPGYHIMHNDKLVLLSTGRIVAPLERQFSDNGDDHAGYVSYTMYSDDGGYSWRPSDNEVNMLPVEAQEPHVVELKDGRLLMLMRTYSGYVTRAFSADQGKTWSAGEAVPALTLPPNSSALNVKRIPSKGDLLLLRANAGPVEPPRRRTPFVSVISSDDGATWSHERVIAGAPDNDYGYPSLTFIDDIALISYHARDGLHVARIPIAWFYED